MSEKLCALRKIGGGMSETVLWTNLAPTSNFSQQNVTLPQDIDNFDSLKFTYKAATNNNTMGEVVISVDEFKNSYASGVTINTLLGARNGSTLYARMVYYVSDTAIQFARAHQVYGTAVVDNMAIPLEIIGLK